MYYLVFGILYLFSSLPFWILYRFSDLAWLILYKIAGYRKKVVMQNLRNAFPGKNEKELKHICSRFYRNFCDTWIEMLKLLSISRNGLSKRIELEVDLLHQLYKSGKTIQGFTGHFMNWEYTTISMPGNQPYPLLGVYMPVGNRIFDRLIIHLRSRFGTILLRAGRIKRDMLPWEDKQYMMGLVADQSPGIPEQAGWMYFLNQPAPFVRKPWLKVIELDQPAVYLKIKRLKRGFYRFTMVPLALDPTATSVKEMMLTYRDLLEEDIINNPDNYLWTHRRWKKKWGKKYEGLWIDNKPAPAIPEEPIPH